MFKIVYLKPDGDYNNFLGTERKDIIEAFNRLESAGEIVITIYDYTNHIQLYRCLNYEFHRCRLLNRQAPIGL